MFQGGERVCGQVAAPAAPASGALRCPLAPPSCPSHTSITSPRCRCHSSCSCAAWPGRCHLGEKQGGVCGGGEGAGEGVRALGGARRAPPSSPALFTPAPPTHLRRLIACTTFSATCSWSRVTSWLEPESKGISIRTRPGWGLGGGGHGPASCALARTPSLPTHPPTHPPATTTARWPRWLARYPSIDERS